MRLSPALVCAFAWVTSYLAWGVLRYCTERCSVQLRVNGKPNLEGNVSLKFNTAHSGSLALFAFTHGCEVGIDVEQIVPVRDMHEIASQFFCPEEASELK